MCAIDSFAGQLELRDLRLVVVARTGSLTDAARVFHLTQSTLSHHLAELENRINTRRLTLTPDGNRFRRVRSREFCRCCGPLIVGGGKESNLQPTNFRSASFPLVRGVQTDRRESRSKAEADAQV